MKRIVLLILGLAMLAGTNQLFAQGTAFTYQGQLKNNGNAANGSYNFTFSLFTTNTGGTAIAGPVTNKAVSVSNGVFTVSVDFGATPWNGETNWMQIAVETNSGSAVFTNLSPRQIVLPTPYAIYAESAAALPGFASFNNSNGAPNIIGGASINFVTPGLVGATISGGGATNFGGNVYSNYVNGNFGTIGGGYNNTAFGANSTVGGGDNNGAGGYATVVAGGEGNNAGGDYSAVLGGNGNNGAGAGDTIVGGFNNSSGGGNNSTIVGGNNNNSSGSDTFIGAGQNNSVSQLFATIGGGVQNQAINNSATIAGGTNNVASGSASTIPGGDSNVASGDDSFAAGVDAMATNNGAFVWSDASGFPFSSTNDNQFSARATGGVVFVTGINGSGVPTAGVQVAPGSGTWASLSDRNAKNGFAPVNPQAVLVGVASLPISRWSYNTEQGVKHLGPMAQDFYAAFGVGEDDRHITTVDEEGVALAAIQGLNQKIDDKDGRIQEQAGQIADLKQQVAELRAMVKQLQENHVK